jgi:hypothetical protein
VATLDSSQLDTFAKAFGLWSGKGGSDFQVLRKYAREHPKSLMWEAGVGLLGGVISMKIVTAEYEKQHAVAAFVVENFNHLMALFREAQSTGQAPPEPGNESDQ